ncbi:hypothetical protein [Streptomyces uncialis]|uniref:hypothetical protein n=1 Tax=Streptomyces uncialis TaxID=1048205 RepID=UPI00224CC20A|nr:hypothetical protein [Streptomyces uncialis]MCX4659125.1 hypothetical protein [Streptomyces uncialis]
MNRPLPRAYWCHADQAVPGSVHLPLPSLTTTAPGEAVRWVRESVRTVAPLLDRDVFHTMWGRLGDHRAVDGAVIALRRGEPCAFTTATPGGGLLSWTAYPVSVLPLAGPGCLLVAASPRPAAARSVAHGPCSSWSTA